MIPLKLKDQRGVTAILFGFMILMLLSFGALAVDLVNLYVAKNQLQNAADAAALAGAQVLYLYDDDNDILTLNTSANQTAKDTAIENKSQETPVEVNWTDGNTGDIQRGHWSFRLGTNPTLDGFYANDSTALTDLSNITKEELDQDPNFINAVKVVARRNATPVASFFARIFGYENFQLEAEAVAYIGFAGSVPKGYIPQPVAICAESITNDTGEEYTCSIGRMLNDNNDTARWSNFTQPCETASDSSVSLLICANGNPDIITFGEGMGTVEGVLQNSLTHLRDCWISSDSTPYEGMPDELWNLTLPVIDCSGSNTCSTALGVVNINVVWITGAGTDPNYNDVPMKMGTWTCGPCSDKACRIACWDSFVAEFNLKDADGDEPAPYEKKSIYFLPDCTPHEPTGSTGKNNYGVLARYPVLVNGED